MPEIICNIALKEWAVTGEALGQGRQIILLRKGGLLDEDGSFCLEHGQFFLLPTWLHQEKSLVKPQHQDLFDVSQKMKGESVQAPYLRHFARVEATWHLEERDEALLKIAPHIYAQSYLDLRFNYQSDKPLLCAALRVWELESPLPYAMRPQDMGCRSWIEMETPLECAAHPVLDDASFAQSLDELSELFR
ncbi:hypothetical protein B1R32_101104 [Abditibacterium utsteinense]|uniref:DUF1802 family protein n=1 Tax=Abditibacterium utsteinense TaxID=1960156 RepID=A0A2S8SX47_9BACT|nr:DUF1802 family protein [Abditibacterium utsteinense]PQV65364.1 hypothetical protein B1R32_101104 [Abditibacterium utsteinense]